MNINPEEFVWLWQGIVRKKFSLDEKHYLAPIRIYRKNNNRAILLLHGFASTPAVYRYLIDACVRYDAVVAPILPGHASCLANFAKTTAPDWLDVAENEYQKLAAVYAEVDVLGLSLGGLLACHIASLFKPHHLYLLAPAIFLNFPLNLGPIIPKILMKLGIKTLRSQGGNIHQHQEAELTYKRLPLTSIIEVLNLIHNFKFTAPSCQTDVFLGKYDAAVHSSKVAKLFYHLPHVKIHWLKHSAHILPLDTDKHIINNIIQNSFSIQKI